MSTAPVVGGPEWRRLVTASKAAAIIGVSPWDSPYSMWHEMKHGTSREQTAVMSRGNYLEPAILAWWHDQHPEFDNWQNQAWAPFGDWAGATVDAVAWSADTPHDLIGRIDAPGTVIVEAKSAARMDEWGDPGTDAIPAYYLTQVYFQLAVTGAARCYIPVIGPYLEFSEYVVDADIEFQDDILSRCRAFYDTLEADEPPELDSSVATYDVVRKQHADIEAGEAVELDQSQAVEFIEALNGEREAKKRERLAKSTVLEAMGRAQYATCNGTRVARRQPNQYSIQINQVAKSATEITTKEESA